MTEPVGFDPRQLFLSLARHGVDYLTIGGVAIQAHGAQRLTRDLDVAIATTAENYERLAAMLAAVDARILDAGGGRSKETPSAPLLAADDQWHLITVFGPLDIVTLPAGAGSFADLRGRAHEVDLEELKIPIAHRDDLITLKRASGRPQDLADAELLESLGNDVGGGDGAAPPG